MSFGGPLTRRARAGAYDAADGYWKDEAPVDTTIDGSVQPTTGRQRSNLPDGYNSTSALLIITDTLMTTADQAGTRPDQVKYNSEWYVVITREPWQNDILNHYAYVVALPDNPDARA